MMFCFAMGALALGWGLGVKLLANFYGTPKALLGFGGSVWKWLRR